MTPALPFSALLSQALVAFTIEFDNEFEHQMPHTTTNHGRTAGTDRVPWLVSMPMWAHCMRHVPPEGIPAAELARRSGLPAKTASMLLKRMSKWWGYLSVKPDPNDPRAKPPPSAWVVRPTRAGRRAREIWEPLETTIEERWCTRFGAGAIGGLETAMAAVVKGLDEPVVSYLLLGDALHPDAARGTRMAGAGEGRKANPDSARAKGRPASPGGGSPPEGSDRSLVALLSTALAAFGRAFDADSDVGLLHSANVIRVLDDDGVRARDLPALTGVAEMGVNNALTFLGRTGYLSVSSPGAGRAKVVRPTPKATAAGRAYADRVEGIEKGWASRLPTDTVARARRHLEALVGSGAVADSPLWKGLEPYPDGWRAQVPRPDTLPHYPVVSHRGGFPDGS